MINNKNKKIKFIILVLVLIIICILFPTLVLKNKDEKILKNAGINKQFIEYKNVSNSSIINDEKIKLLIDENNKNNILVSFFYDWWKFKKRIR